MGAPRSRLWVACACLSQCGLMPPSTPARLAASWTIRRIRERSSGLPVRERNTGDSGSRAASKVSRSFHIAAGSRTARVFPALPHTVSCPASARARRFRQRRLHASETRSPAVYSSTSKTRLRGSASSDMIRWTAVEQTGEYKANSGFTPLFMSRQNSLYCRPANHIA